MSENAGGTSDQTTARDTEDTLLMHAVTVLRRRYEEGGRYGELPPSAASELGDVLSGLATSQQTPPGVDRAEALALAHRLIDDDHPELSPMWPGAAG